MLDKFFESVTGELGKNWLAAVFKPAFVFWAGGVTAWAWHGHWDRLKSWALNFSTSERVMVILIVFLVVVASDAFVAKADRIVIRFLEGYWPRWMKPLRTLLIRRWTSHYAKSDRRFQRLQAKRDAGTLTAEDRTDLAETEKILRAFPSSISEYMPSRIGNMLKAAEHRSVDKYGLDAVICWPRLWLILPDGVKGDLKEARANLDGAVRAWSWSFLFLVWMVWTWWALLAAGIGMYLAYRWAILAAEVYGDLLESAFDVHRMTLYKAVRWPLPMSPQDERSSGEKLTQYFWRGSTDASARFTSEKD